MLASEGAFVKNPDTTATVCAEWTTTCRRLSELREGCAPGGPGTRRPARAVDFDEKKPGRAAVGPARLATVVSLPTARAARPGAQRRDTPEPGRCRSVGSRAGRTRTWNQCR